MSANSQFALLRQRRFAPIFWVQFLGAANNNVFKFAFTLLATCSAARWGNVEPKFACFLIAALFFAPFVLFSATSGQLADKLETSWFIRRIKDTEIAATTVGAALSDGDLVSIFPKSRITDDGERSPFKQGVKRIGARVPVPAIPMALRGLWASIISRHGGAAFLRPASASDRCSRSPLAAQQPGTVLCGRLAPQRQSLR